jgi:hypothetical protein
MDRLHAVDWLETASRVVGVVGLLISLFCAYVTVALIFDLRESAPGFVKTLGGWGIAFFAVAAVVAFATGMWFLGDARWSRRRRSFGEGPGIRRHQIPSFVRHLTSAAEFQATQSWEERCEVAARLVPELHNAFVSGDWEQRLQAESIVRTAWSHCLGNAAR